jgi:histidyl-tRNA synthetase
LETITALPGTRDLLAPEIARWQDMEANARRILTAACFSEIRTPIFERTQLFERGVGEATDVVEKQMYTFASRDGKDRMTLRPENTAGVVRAFLQHGLRSRLPSPLKLWYLGPMFRYERPQKGRQRQFHQLGVETIGSLDPRADAEVILVACEFLRACGLDDLVVELNSLGDPEDRTRHRDALVGFLNSVKGDLDEEAVSRIERNPLRVLDSKNERTRAAVQDAPSILDFLGEEARLHFERVQEALTACGVRFRPNPGLVRGLDYYSRTTFEIQSEKLGAQSTVCGGGRYDGLVEELGGPSVPAVGWALGLERLALVLDETFGPVEEPGPDACIVTLGDEAEAAALPLARDLRRAGVRCDVGFGSGNVGKQLKGADRRRAKLAVVVGPDELARGTASVKNLTTGEQTEVARGELAAHLLREASAGGAPAEARGR